MTVIVHLRPTWSPDGIPFFGVLSRLISPTWALALMSNSDMFLESSESAEPGALVCSGFKVGLVFRSDPEDLGYGRINYRIHAIPTDLSCPECLAREVMLT